MFALSKFRGPEYLRTWNRLETNQNVANLLSTDLINTRLYIETTKCMFKLDGFFSLYNRTPMNFLLLNLAVADMMVALFITPRFILSHFFTHPDGKTGTLFCKLLTGGNFTWTGGAASVFTLVAIAFERYYAVIYPYGNKGKLTYNKLMVSETECVWMRRMSWVNLNCWEKIGYLLVSCGEKGIRIPLPPAASGTLRKKTFTPCHPRWLDNCSLMISRNSDYVIASPPFTCMQLLVIFPRLYLPITIFFKLAIFRTKLSSNLPNSARNRFSNETRVRIFLKATKFSPSVRLPLLASSRAPIFFDDPSVRNHITEQEMIRLANEFKPILGSHFFPACFFVRPSWLLKLTNWWLTSSLTYMSDHYSYVMDFSSNSQRPTVFDNLLR